MSDTALDRGGPIVRRMLVGARLRRLRTEQGITREQAQVGPAGVAQQAVQPGEGGQASMASTQAAHASPAGHHRGDALRAVEVTGAGLHPAPSVCGIATSPTSHLARSPASVAGLRPGSVTDGVTRVGPEPS